MTHLRLRLAAAMTAIGLIALSPARAWPLSAPGCAQANADIASPASWPAPLDTPVSLQARGVSLRDALDRLGALSGVALAYSSDLLPLDRTVCVMAERQPLGRVLAELLAGTRVQAIVVSGRVVLAPNTGVRAEQPASKVSVLERVIVTGNAVGTARRPLSVGVEVIDGDQLRRAGFSSLSSALDASVPGLWVWDQAPGSVVSQYGGVRGASSFSTSYPKMYIDGVEVANPLLVTQLDPDVVDRIEVIRGPQGSALYGSDAISGVINVITRHDGSPAAGARVLLSSVAGASASQFGPNLVPTHDQRVTVRGGTNLRSAGLSMEFGQTGAVFPSSQSRQLSVVGDARAVTSSATWSGSARLFDKSAGLGDNPLLGALDTSPTETRQSGQSPTYGSMTGTKVVTPRSAGDAQQRVRLYTLGGSAMLAPVGVWTNTFVAGIDGYRLKDVGDASSPVPSALDAAIVGSRGGGDRATFRASSVAQIGETSLTPPTTLTLSLEHSVLRQSGTVTNVSSPVAGQRYATATSGLLESWNHNTGALAQASTSWRDAVFMTGGLRLERNDAFAGSDRYPLLPLLGAAVVHAFGNTEVKLRSSYGKGIRPPQTSVRGSWSTQSMSGERNGLDPEVQTGIESGVELYFGQSLSLQATRFDQRATGLIQNVATAIDTQVRSGTPERRMRFQLENVGEITNRGWELQAAAHRGALSVSGTFTAVDSRVRAVAPGYLGDLRAGDRMLAVPARTASLTTSWTAARWSTMLTATRASDWVNYDRVALASAYAGTGTSPSRDVTGWRLREFWRSYTGETHLRLTTSRDVGRGLTLLLTGDNLLGGQVGEPDNLTIRQGRTITGGLRASF